MDTLGITKEPKASSVTRDYLCMGPKIPGGRKIRRAWSPEEADDKVGGLSWLIINSRTLKSVGAKRVKRVRGYCLSDFETLYDTQLQEGNTCNISVGDPVEILEVRYFDIVEIGDDIFFCFIKNNIDIWAWKRVTRFFRED